MTVEAFERSKYNTASSSSSSSSASIPLSPFEAAAASTSALARRRNARLERREREDSERFDARRALDRLGNAVARGAATGALLDATGSWEIALFGPTTALLLIGAATFVGAGSAQRQDWAAANQPFALEAVWARWTRGGEGGEARQEARAGGHD